MPELRRQNEPPKPGPDVEVIRCEGKAGVRVQIVSDSIWGVWTHWDGHRSRECTGEGQECQGHANGWPTRWKGYLYVWCATRKSFCFVELTPAAATEIIRQQGTIPSLRGYLLRLDRTGSSIRCKVAVELTASPAGGCSLPKAISPEPVLRKLWGWREGA